MSKYIDADKITPIMAEYVADVFSRKEHLDNISYGYCMEIADVFRRYAERAKQEVDLNAHIEPKIDVTQMAYNELMRLYKAVRDELYRRNNETPKLLID